MELFHLIVMLFLLAKIVTEKLCFQSGQSSVAGSTGYKVQSFGIPATVVKETEVSVIPFENKPTYTETKKIHKEVKFAAENEVNPLPLTSVAESHVDAKIDINAEAQRPTVLVKEVSF